jgi:hypothetical protein
MCRRIVFIPASLTSVFQQFIDIGDLASHLVMIVVGLCVLEDELSIEELFIDVLWRIIPAADDEDLGRNES